MANNTFDYEIVERIATLNDDPKASWTKEINLVSFGGNPAKYDIRSWGPNHERMGKGITLSKNELHKLHLALYEIFK